MSAYAGDRGEWLSVALESMAAQTVAPEKMVLVFDGPVSDDVERVVSGFASAHPGLLDLVRIPENGGLGPALNAGLKRCASEVIVRMDADDWSDPTRCERQLGKIVEGCDMVGSNVAEFSEDMHSPRALRVLPETRSEVFRFAHGRSPFAHPAFCVRRDALELVGGYRDVRFAEDYDLFIRLLAAGFEGVNIQSPLVFMRVNEDAYRRRGGISYLKDMFAFNYGHVKEGWFSPGDFLRRSIANSVAALVPNFVRDALYRHILRNKFNVKGK